MSATDILKVIDPFESETPDAQVSTPDVERGLQRDGRGRPLLYPAKGPRVRVPYSRMSSLADYVSDQRGVHTWEDRYLAQAMALYPDLAALAATHNYNTGFNQPETKEKRAAGRELDAIIYRALDRMMIHELADYGTAFHKRTEPGDDGRTYDEPLTQMCESFEQATRGIKFLATELFVANDELQAAGTFDHLVRVPGYEGACILDKKTGELHPEEFGVQFSGYGNAELYDPETDERFSLESQFGPINRKWAFVAWTPSREVKGVKAKGQPARTLIYPIDIERGYVAAKVAVWVRDYQRGSSDIMGRALNPVALVRARAAEELDAATTMDEMNAVFETYRDVWTEELMQRGGQRIAAGEVAA